MNIGPRVFHRLHHPPRNDDHKTDDGDDEGGVCAFHNGDENVGEEAVVAEGNVDGSEKSVLEEVAAVEETAEGKVGVDRDETQREEVEVVAEASNNHPYGDDDDVAVMVVVLGDEVVLFQIHEVMVDHVHRGVPLVGHSII